MKVSEIIERMNSGTKRSDMAEMLGIGVDTLRRTLQKAGYGFNNSSKFYEFEGELSDKNQIDNREFESFRNKKIFTKKKKNIQESKEGQTEVIEISDKNEEMNLTKEEIKMIKRFLKPENELMLFFELSQLPVKKKTKKSSIEISEELHEEFNEFANRFADRRISKNDLIEVALYRLMREYR